MAVNCYLFANSFFRMIIRSGSALLIIVSCCLLGETKAKDLGVQGHLYEIMEPDMLLTLTQRLHAWQDSGKLDDLQHQLVQQTRERLMRPAPVVGLQRTITRRQWRYDPSLTLGQNLKDQRGQVFYRQGTRFNPLAYQQLSRPLVFFNGDDPEQVAWIEHNYITPKQSAKLILVQGAPFKLMERWDLPVYFDQGGVLTTKFNIKAVPARVSQPTPQAQHLVVEELVCDPSDNKGQRP